MWLQKNEIKLSTTLHIHSASGNKRDTILTLVNASWITCCSDGAATGMLGRCGWKICHSIVESVRNTVLIEKCAAVNGGRRCSFICSVERLWRNEDRPSA
jgi:hypothetical protein